MDKLIKLLNERKWSKTYYAVNWSIRMVWYYPVSELELISKNSWFIKWLVDNDKIDFHKLKVNYIYHDDEWDWEKELLMQLAIQDEPIEFLISILK